ncbi:two-component regulator propeller domain-containing protein [Bacteroides sp. GM023]|uniref:hybrid sensor histidine kinase/response regulator transcription factor n=1 Tax=Bacteroides sp. GM023 TaxID=2723058 RepID=UPI00168B9EA1|nr:two-component regulator propeller domain-containing protein [Bacteroides sp. GM023]MBD3589673.1 response regulator [Bacteroides sp. GM023]
MKYIIYLLFLFPICATAQTYKYIGTENGLSNRRIFSIKKDAQGYMWFLTDEGMDRYNGKDIKHYKLNKEDSTLEAPIHLGWIYTTPQIGTWVIGKQGRIFHYETKYDDFKMVYKLPDSMETISYGYMDRNDNFWLCRKHSILLYNAKDGQIIQFPNVLHSNITAIEQVDEQHFFIATETGVRYTKLENDVLEIIPVETLDYFHAQVSELYYHQPLQRLVIGSFERGMFVYDMKRQEIIKPEADLSDVNITCIVPLDESQLLISTEGMGVYKIDINTCKLDHYIVANYQSYNEMNGNNINDVFVDEEKRIWLSNYPTGVTVIDYRYENYHWMKHAMGNKQSLINDQVHAVIEDNDGDLWFGTSNGISLYNSRTGQWYSFLSSFDQQLKDKNHIFITLCEVSPGIIWAGGYTSGIYKINKHTLSVEYFSPYLLTPINMRPDKYIRDMIKDSKGYIWSGGYYNLKCFDLTTNSVHLYPGVTSITSIVEHDKDHMWIGTAAGVYLLDRNTGKYQFVETGIGASYINSLYQSNDGLLYIGTNGAGVLVYDIKNQNIEHYYTDNSALVSNRIFTILPEADGRIMMSTENGITCFFTKEKVFHNWTRGEGLLPAYFNASSGTLRKNKNFVFGSTDGAIEIPENVTFPHYKFSKMIFSDFQLSYQPVYPDEKNSPLKECIDKTEVLKLKHNKNTFSLVVSTINYDSPGNALYSWKLEGFYEKWTQPGASNLIRFTNLPPGKYTLRVRAVSREEHDVVFEERAMKIIITQPFWSTWWAILCYVLLVIWGFSFIIRMINLRKQKKISDEKTQFFINTAHDIRTPLTLIKAPLQELLEEETLSEIGITRTQTALRNVDSLLRMSSNLINFERTDVYSSKLCISEYELNTYMKEVRDAFTNYATLKNIDFTYESTFNYLNVWFDKDKMDSILKNIISNSLKYTPESGKVSVSVSETSDSWKVVITDTGIGIPSTEQSKLFKLHFRASNAINSKVTGSGIGLMLVGKQVRLHGGKINVESVEQQGTTVRIVFPKDTRHLQDSEQKPSTESDLKTPELTVPGTFKSVANAADNADAQRVLVVEDNDELRSYLVSLLSPLYNVQACGNGKEALIIVKEFWPELILTDVMMPEMRGDELCVAIKNDIETSHIPVLLLTALGEEKNILEGLAIGADEYIIKPFNVTILRESIKNLLNNRALLRSRYANPNMDMGAMVPSAKGANSLDWKFISEVRQSVEDNLDNTGLTVNVLCEIHHMSRTSFYSKLRALTGQSPTAFIRTTRLKRAAELLKEGRHNITEISEMTGFSETKYFREVFKKYYKMSPSQYAKSGGSTSPILTEEDDSEDEDSDD